MPVGYGHFRPSHPLPFLPLLPSNGFVRCDLSILMRLTKKCLRECRSGDQPTTFCTATAPPPKKSPHFWRCLKALNRRLESMERRLQNMNLDNLKAGPGDWENREKLGKCLVEMELTGQEACHICNHIKLRRIKLMRHQWVYRRRGKFAT